MTRSPRMHTALHTGAPVAGHRVEPAAAVEAPPGIQEHAQADCSESLPASLPVALRDELLLAEDLRLQLDGVRVGSGDDARRIVRMRMLVRTRVRMRVILARGFARARCDACGHDFLIAFSCKGQGVCPSCDARRMVDIAAHLIDHVPPELPLRQ